jgi:multidrug efflux pump
MSSVLDAVFSRARVVLTALAVVIFFGIYAYTTIPREANPDIAAPFVLVSLPLPGVSPEDGERLLVRPTEVELQTVEGVKQMDSYAYDGAAQIVVEFETTIDIDQAVLDVREAVDRAKADYPSDAEEPIVSEFNLQNQFPILTVVLYGDAPERALFQTARALEDKLDSVPGVLEANLTGARDELLEVIVDPTTLDSYGLTVAEVANAVSANNRLVTVGAIEAEDGRFQVKAPGLIKGGADVMSTPVRAVGDRIVTIGDLAEVRRTFVDRDGYALFNGQPAIGVELSKRAGANIVETIVAARAVVAKESAQWPSSVRHDFLNDQSVFVRDSLSNLTSSVVTAVLLVMLIIIMTLGWRSALLVGVTIPSTFFMTFMALVIGGYTLNMMVMFGLILAIGMLVDGAIVVIEYADRRMAEGADRRTAFIEAAKRMFWPVVTSTATTLAAFAPFLFWNDITGEFMKFIPITLIFTLTASLIAALVMMPVVGSMLGIPDSWKKRLNIKGKTGGPRESDLEAADPLALRGWLGRYARFLQAVIARPLLMLVAAIAFMVVSIGAFRVASPDVEFFIRNDSEEVVLLVLARGNLSPEQRLVMTREVEERIASHYAIQHIYVQTGSMLARGDDTPPETIGRITLDLRPYSKRAHSNIVMEELRDLVADVPGMLVEVRQREGGPPVGKDVQIEITGGDIRDMVTAAKAMRKFLDDDTILINGVETPTYMDQEDSLPLPGIEWAMEVDRERAGAYGLSISEAGSALQLATNGLLVDRYRPDDSDEEIDIRVRYPAEDRTLGALESVRVQTAKGSVPVSNFVTREARAQVDRITRRNGERVIDVKANGSTRFDDRPVSQDQAIAEARAFLESGAIGDKVSWVIRGADEETNEAAAFFKAAMAAALFMIAIILLLEFNSFYHSALTLSAVIFSVCGVLLGIAISGQYVSVIMTGVGVVALAGIVVNNNIVLIDTYQQLRRQGFAMEDAALRCGVQRLRPVFLTTTTTMLGLLPMVFQINVDYRAGSIGIGSTTSDWWVLLASAVVYGLFFSSLLTLVLTPALLAAPATIRRRLSRKAAGGAAIDLGPFGSLSARNRTRDAAE